MSQLHTLALKLSPELRSKFKEIQELYNAAEAELSRAASVVGDLEFIPVNQLRYAGRHLIDALNLTDATQIELELMQSKGHCKRALFDTYDVLLDFYIQSINLILQDYSLIALDNIIDNEKEIRTFAASAPVAVTRKKASGKKRSEFYKEIKATLDTAEAYYVQLKASIPEMNKAVDEYNNKIWKNRVLQLFALIGFLGSLASIASFVVSR
ncbi:MAG: hypothetical protein CSA54_03585 [Gammaproteobacteria bacterium]|nr:MAG: hypothetical protein CSA54_03585 [Gammaproteobacteria bacterium]